MGTCGEKLSSAPSTTTLVEGTAGRSFRLAIMNCAQITYSILALLFVLLVEFATGCFMMLEYPTHEITFRRACGECSIIDGGGTPVYSTTFGAGRSCIEEYALDFTYHQYLAFVEKFLASLIAHVLILSAMCKASFSIKKDVDPKIMIPVISVLVIDMIFEMHMGLFAVKIPETENLQITSSMRCSQAFTYADDYAVDLGAFGFQVLAVRLVVAIIIAASLGFGTLIKKKCCKPTGANDDGKDISL